MSIMLRYARAIYDRPARDSIIDPDGLNATEKAEIRSMLEMVVRSVKSVCAERGVTDLDGIVMVAIASAMTLGYDVAQFEREQFEQMLGDVEVS